MQKKYDDICGFKLFVLIVFKAVKEPNKYEPLSPKNIFAFGKLNNKNDNIAIICPIKTIENSKKLNLIFIYKSIELIINKLIIKSPLKPSIKFAPFIINRKHKTTKVIKKNLL